MWTERYEAICFRAAVTAIRVTYSLRNALARRLFVRMVAGTETSDRSSCGGRAPSLLLFAAYSVGNSSLAATTRAAPFGNHRQTRKI